MRIVPLSDSDIKLGGFIRRPFLMGCLLIAALSFLAFYPSLSGGFIWNDNAYVTAPTLRGFDGVSQIWTHLGATEQYYPVLHSFFWVEYHLYGLNPFPYRLTNLLLHVFSAIAYGCFILLVLSISQMYGRGNSAPLESHRSNSDLHIAIACLAAAIFAVHPVNVQTVAWITEEKNTLSLLMVLLSGCEYLLFTVHRSYKHYWLSLLLLIIALGSKTAIAIFPLCLLLLLWWIGGRRLMFRNIKPLLPFILLSGMGAALSTWVEHDFVGAEGEDFNLPFWSRALIASRSILDYLWRLIWPVNLHFIYSNWDVTGSKWNACIPMVILLFFGLLCWRLRTRFPAIGVIAVLFILCLSPALGFINLYGSLYSQTWDHWQYVADLCPIGLFASTIVYAVNSSVALIRDIMKCLVGIMLAGLTVLSWQHSKIFRNDIALFSDATGACCESWMAHNNLGNEYSKIPGQISKAAYEFRIATELRPDSFITHGNLGRALMVFPNGRSAAIREYEESLRLFPWQEDVHYNLANALSDDPKYRRAAIAHYRMALKMNPGLAIAHNNLAILLSSDPNDRLSAMEEYRRSLAIDPANVAAHFDYANLLLQIPKQVQHAIFEYKRALQLDPSFAEAHINLGCALSDNPDQLEEAIDELQAGLRLNSGIGPAWEKMGNIYMSIGDYRHATNSFEEALRLDPTNVSALRALRMAKRFQRE